MVNTLKRLDAWHRTRTGLLVFGLLELGLAYLFFSLAVNSGSLWQWTLTVILLFGGLRSIVLVFKEYKK